MKHLPVIVISSFVIVLLFFMICVEIVPLDKVGVRSNMLGDGVEDKDLKPGMQIIIPGIHKLDILDPTLQELTFASERGEGPLKLRTSDQYTTQVDLTIFYSIREGKAWEVLTKMGPGYAFTHRFGQIARDAIWRVMGKMKTEDFYDSAKRIEFAERTIEYLNKELAKMTDDQKGMIQANDLLIRKVVFDPRFETQLINKQLLDQRTLLAKSEKLREEEKEKTELIEKKTAADVLAINESKRQEIQTKIAENEREVAKIIADARLKVKTRLSIANRAKREAIANAEKMKEIARAQGQKAINEAYQSFGGQMLLSRKFVENIKVGKIEINTNQVNPFDTEQFLKMVGAEVEVKK